MEEAATDENMDGAAKTDGFGQAFGLTKRVESRKMGTDVRISAPGCERHADGENEEDKMAFSCVMHLKEECDGCGACEERLKRTDEEAWIAETEM